MKLKVHYHLHGDNIIECERAIELIAQALDATVHLIGGNPSCPVWQLSSSEQRIHVRCFPGYHRWSTSILDGLATSLREAPDALLCELRGNKERPIVAWEFCGALPAGNNAWQRSGRALGLAHAGVPYLYYSELGGLELDVRREPKSSRLPNPLVPFSYVAHSGRCSAPPLPVYVPAPSAPVSEQQRWADMFGEQDALDFLQALLRQTSQSPSAKRLIEKGQKAVLALIEGRRRSDTAPSEVWQHMSRAGNNVAAVAAKAEWPWKKKVSIPTTPSFSILLDMVSKRFGFAIGSGSMPLCVIPATRRRDLSKEIAELHVSDPSFTRWVSHGSGPLVMVWVAGFKPRGDDSRPDRGLLPLARMVLGPDVDILTVVYGPAKSVTWDTLRTEPSLLAKRNGLWEAIFQCSDGLLVDSRTQTPGQQMGGILLDTEAVDMPPDDQDSPNAWPTKLGEHDIDTCIHTIFHHGLPDQAFEMMCNPPGGDWSGVSFRANDSGKEWRWTSLPRVSATGAKRPDHIFLLHRSGAQDLLLVIESKDKVGSLRENVGPDLVQYVEDLLHHDPTIERNQSGERWVPAQSKPCLEGQRSVSIIAFLDTTDDRIAAGLKKTAADIAIAIQLKPERIVLRVFGSSDALLWLRPVLRQSEHALPWRIEVEINRLSD